jgi:hypothetical protein
MYVLVDGFSRPILFGGRSLIWYRLVSQELDKALPEPLPRQFPKDDDQSLVRRNRRMLGKLLVGTLEVTKSSDV